MKKKLSLFLAGILMAATVPAAMAEEQIKVVVDGREIAFSDQKPIMENDRVLVPARGVFEAAGCNVLWLEEEQCALVDSRDRITRVAIDIDSDVLRVFTFTSVIEMVQNDVKIDVPARVMNDRTMIPLRAVAEAVKSDVAWDEETNTVNIVTLPELNEEELPRIYMTADKTECKSGEEVTVSVFADKLENIDAEYVLTSVTSTIKYNSDVFEYSSVKYVPENPTYASLSAENPNYLDESVKMVSIVMDCPIDKTKPIELARVTFTAKAAGDAEFEISSKRDTKIGEATQIGISKGEASTNMEIGSVGTAFIDTTPIAVKVAE